MASMAEKTAVLAPMPSARVRMTAAENEGERRRKRRAARKLKRRVSSERGEVHFADLLLDLLAAAEFEDGAAAGFLGGQALGDAAG